MNKETNIQTNIATEEETKKLTKRERLMIGVIVANTCIAVYFGIKCAGDRKQIEQIKKLRDDTNTLMHLVYF